MKDIQGVQRGKCNSCECEEYRAPLKSGQIRCDYCDHTPGEHVKIIELGECTKCGKDECEKYVSETPNKYTDCEYCGCTASLHAGAEELRKFSRPAGQPVSQGSGPVYSLPPGTTPRMDAYGKSLQQASYGNCMCPGCTFPKRREGSKVHDFCSKTCAKKYSDMQAFHQPKSVVVKAVQGGRYIQSGPGGSYTQSGPGGSNTHSTQSAPHERTAFSKPPDPSDPLQQPVRAGLTAGPPATGGKMCHKCQVMPVNPGRSWCERCFRQSSS